MVSSCVRMFARTCVHRVQRACAHPLKTPTLQPTRPHGHLLGSLVSSAERARRGTFSRNMDDPIHSMKQPFR